METFLMVVLPSLLLGLLLGSGIAFGVARMTTWRLYFRAKACGLDLPFSHVLQLQFSKLDITALIGARVDAWNHGIDLKEEHILRYLASGCDVRRAVNSVVAARGLKVEMTFDQACSMMLAEQDPMAVCEEAANPSMFIGGKAARHALGTVGQASCEILPVGSIRIGNREVKAVCRDGVPIARGARIAVQGYVEEVVIVAAG